MTQVKELYDSLSEEQKKMYGLGIWGSDDELINQPSMPFLRTAVRLRSSMGNVGPVTLAYERQIKASKLRFDPEKIFI